MKPILSNVGVRSGLFALLMLLGFAKPGFALDLNDGACDVGTTATNCTISTEHTVGTNLVIEGDLTITSTGQIKFMIGTGPKQLYVKGNLVIEAAGGQISYEGTGTANPALSGGTLDIIVDGNATVSGRVSVKGGNGSNVRGGLGATGGSGGTLTFKVCGNLTSTGEITAKGGNGGQSTGSSAVAGGNGGSGGTILINVNGSVTVAGNVHAQGGNKGQGNPDGLNGSNGAITINTAQAAGAVNTVGADFNPAATINLEQVDPAQCNQSAPQGCSQGYWKNHPGSWTGYATGDTVGSVFNNAGTFAGISLIEALSLPGGPGADGAKQNLLRQAVAALLNAAHPDVNYPLLVADVINNVSAQLGVTTSDTIGALKNTLEAYNLLGCPLN